MDGPIASGKQAGRETVTVAECAIPSIFLSENSVLDFFSDFRPSATTLHRAQGCFPSNVRSNAVVKDVRVRLLASMVLQANDCKTAQCRPTEQASATAVRSVGNR